ncbi:MAG: dTDP-4-dehydrorhamnose reductase [Oscillospiraceae bacterium]
MKIMITGSHGQLGNEIQEILGSKKSEIGSIHAIYDNCEVIAVDINELDITNAKDVNNFIDNIHPDLIINCAAMTNVDACETEYITAMKVNAIGPMNLAIAAENANAKLVHISTDYVFSGDDATPYCEWDATNPNSIYGKSKRLGEVYVCEHCTKYFLVRTAWLYGYIGNNFVKTMRKLGREKDSISVVDDQMGNPTNANDLAHHILELAATECYGIYHCTGKGECSWYEFASKIMQLSDIDCKVSPCSTEKFALISKRPAKRPAYSSLRNLSLECTIGDNMRNWESALENYIKKLNALEENQK